MEPPLSTRACGLVVGGRSPGSRAHPPRLPDPPSGRSVAALSRRGWHPRSQWRVRAGFAPASLRHRPFIYEVILQGGEVCIETRELLALSLVEHRAFRDQPARCVEKLPHGPTRIERSQRAVLGYEIGARFTCSRVNDSVDWIALESRATEQRGAQ